MQLKKGEHAFGVTFESLFEEADCTPKNAVTWAVLTELFRQGRLEMVKETLPGVREGLQRTRFNYIYYP